VVCGALAFNEKLRKHVMHLAAMVGLFGVVGGFMPLIRQIDGGGGFDPLKRSAIAGDLTVVISAVFVGLCVNSFIQARKARQAREAAQNAGQG
jgi:biopolymer transport protein ExbB/TolQ